MHHHRHRLRLELALAGKTRSAGGLNMAELRKIAENKGINTHGLLRIEIEALLGSADVKRTIVGAGVAGCIVTPAIKCERFDPELLTVSKLQPNQRAYTEEYIGNIVITAALPAATIKILNRCEISAEPVAELLETCRAGHEVNFTGNKTVYDTLYPYVEGRTLSAYNSNPTVYMQLIKAIVPYIEELYSWGVAHGDLHDGNIIITPSGKPMLIDYGFVAPTFASGRWYILFDLKELFYNIAAIDIPLDSTMDVTLDYMEYKVTEDIKVKIRRRHPVELFCFWYNIYYQFINDSYISSLNWDKTIITPGELSIRKYIASGFAAASNMQNSSNMINFIASRYVMSSEYSKLNGLAVTVLKNALAGGSGEFSKIAKLFPHNTDITEDIITAKLDTIAALT